MRSIALVRWYSVVDMSFFHFFRRKWFRLDGSITTHSLLVTEPRKPYPARCSLLQPISVWS